jgi:hypothetical protein
MLVELSPMSICSYFTSFILISFNIWPFFRFIRKKWLKVMEAGFVAVVTALMAFILMIGIDDCTSTKPFGNHTITSKVCFSLYQLVR